MIFPSKMSDDELARCRPGPFDPPCELGECPICDERFRREELAQAKARMGPHEPDHMELPF